MRKTKTFKRQKKYLTKTKKHKKSCITDEVLRIQNLFFQIRKKNMKKIKK